MPDTLAQRVRAKYPGAYDDLNDQQLEAAVKAKYPSVYDDIPTTHAESPSMVSQAGGVVKDVAIGAGKGFLNTVGGLGQLARKIPGVNALDRVMEPIPIDIEPKNRAQSIGKTAEQIGEFFVPVMGTGGKLAQAAKASGLTMAQTRSGEAAATTAALSAVLPGAGAVVKAGKAFQKSANPLVRAAIKPTVTSLKRISGGGGLDAKAERLVQFIVDNKLVQASKARDLFQRTERELQAVLAKAPQATDAATRAQRYLDALERSASKQGLPASDIAQIRNAAAELLQGPMGEDVVTMVAQAHPSLVDQFGKPIQVLVPKIARQLRGNVPADEALTSARSSGRWSTNKQWGEMKGTAVEAQKAVERGQRDAVKAAVPEARDLLQRESLALKAEEVLDRMSQRSGNRDVASLPAHVIAAGELATGRVPVLAFAANWLRNNQMKAGIWANELGKAIEAGNAPKVATILKRLGVAEAAQVMRPATPQAQGR